MDSTFGTLSADGSVYTSLAPGREQKQVMLMQRWLDARLAGTKNPTLFVGDTVKVKQGEDIGHVAEVLDVRGHAYSADNRVFIENSKGELVYYHPWDIEVVSRRVK